MPVMARRIMIENPQIWGIQVWCRDGIHEPLALKDRVADAARQNRLKVRQAFSRRSEPNLLGAERPDGRYPGRKLLSGAGLCAKQRVCA